MSIGQSHVITFCKSDMNLYSNIICKLSEFFVKAQYNYELGLYDGPVYCTIIIPKLDPNEKVKEADEDTILERFYWILNNMDMPSQGAKIEVQESESLNNNVEMPWTTHYMWRLKENWKPSDNNYIVVHNHYEQDHWKANNNTHSVKRSKYLPAEVELVCSIAKEKGLSIEYVDYTTKVEKVHELLKNCKHYFGYVGSTAFLANLMRVPITFIGARKDAHLPYCGEAAAHVHSRIRPVPPIALGYWQGFYGQMQHWDFQRERVIGSRQRGHDGIVNEVNDDTHLQRAEEKIRKELNRKHKPSVHLKWGTPCDLDEPVLFHKPNVVYSDNYTVYNRDQVYIDNNNIIVLTPAYAKQYIDMDVSWDDLVKQIKDLSPSRKNSAEIVQSNVKFDLILK